MCYFDDDRLRVDCVAVQSVNTFFEVFDLWLLFGVQINKTLNIHLF